MLEKLNAKEKELSGKVTEIYQLKTTLKESEKTYLNLQRRYEVLQKEAGGYREQLETDSKGVLNLNVEIQEENLQLKEQVQELRDEVRTATEKISSLGEINKGLERELLRWRERF